MAQMRLADFIEFSNIYRQHMTADFPAEELKPLSVIEKMYALGKYETFVFEEDGQIKAYASFIWHHKEVRLLDYFAVTRDAGRGTGIGSWFLTELTATVKAKGFILECEVPEKAANDTEKNLREKRIAFYERNGAVMTPVRVKVFDVDFLLLYMPVGEALENINVRDEFINIYHNITPRELFQRNVSIS
ncbi:GNAT family N-acetyltransferase [Polluticaenibacter yanchengensis]|uniref:GNAT family N-acetyltransferase n=1 Tax=Polluticaenibacter yanchengensis TaxID=3014562 RepID=A0ABT4UNB5_9BACT|nr:GNAT family N-acetyltransferase [Chitinophagaceae bacterium LY-5]